MHQPFIITKITFHLISTFSILFKATVVTLVLKVKTYFKIYQRFSRFYSWPHFTSIFYIFFTDLDSCEVTVWPWSLTQATCNLVTTGVTNYFYAIFPGLFVIYLCCLTWWYYMMTKKKNMHVRTIRWTPKGWAHCWYKLHYCGPTWILKQFHIANIK